jgi:hypothetical protein
MTIFLFKKNMLKNLYPAVKSCIAFPQLPQGAEHFFPRRSPQQHCYRIKANRKSNLKIDFMQFSIANCYTTVPPVLRFFFAEVNAKLQIFAYLCFPCPKNKKRR